MNFIFQILYRNNNCNLFIKFIIFILKTMDSKQYLLGRKCHGRASAKDHSQFRVDELKVIQKIDPVQKNRTHQTPEKDEKK
jgi:hypothetical protein